MPGMMCHFHTDEWSLGVRQQDGTYAHVCERRKGHPGFAGSRQTVAWQRRVAVTTCGRWWRWTGKEGPSQGAAG